MKRSPSALSTVRLAVIATLGVLFPRTAIATPAFVQGTAFSTGSRVPALTVTLSRAVAQGDLLVGYFADYNAPGGVEVSDNVNGSWLRAPAGSLTFDDDTGDIALYYRENSRAAPGGITITVSVSSTAYLQGSVAEYSGVALAGSLDQIAARHLEDLTAVDTGPTPAVGAGELVFAAVVTDAPAGSVSPGSSQGIRYTARAQTTSGSAFEEDITSSAAGPQHGTATLTNVVEWYAVCAVFHAYPATPPVPPSTPAGLEATSVASTRVALSWSPSTGSVAGYTVYRNGVAIGMTGPDTTIFLDWDVTPATTHTYAVDAFDLVNDHSAPSAPFTVTTPTVSPEFVQGVADSPGYRTTSHSLTLTEPVLAGDLLVGWFSQYNVSGQVQVRDNVNGAWTRSSVATTWGGAGDIALYYRQNSASAPSGLTITVSASASAYLQEAIADFRHVATVGALDQAVVAQGTGTLASVGPTAQVPAGELVVAAVLTGGRPGWVTPGSSQMVPYLVDAENGSTASTLEDILSSAAGPQVGSLTLGASTNWNMVLATFKPAGGSTTTTSPTSTTTTSPTPTSTTSTSTTTTVPSTTTSTTTSTSTTTTTTLPGTTTGLTSSVHPSVFGQPVTFTATVTANSPGAGTPTGTVTFKDGPSTLGTGTLNSSGQATFTTSALAAGSHSLTASYGGDAHFSGSTSSTFTQTVKKAGTTTSVSSSANPSVSGQSVTFTATVAAKSPGGGTPSGTVTFKDGPSTLGTGTLNGSGQATFTTSALAAGSHSITASYDGDANFKGSTSPKFTQTVNPG